MKYNHRCKKREGLPGLVTENDEPWMILDVDPEVIDNLILSGEIDKLQKMINLSKETYVGSHESM